MESQVFSIRMRADVYRQLKSEIGWGKVSKFIEHLVRKELEERTRKVAQEYQEAARDKKRWKEASEWEMAQMTDWDKHDDGENN